MRVVVDTNGVVSRAISPTGAPAEILRRWRAGGIELAVSADILAEYERALGYGRVRARHGQSPEDIRETIEEFREFAILVEPEETPALVRDDPDDDKFLWCADAVQAQFVITRDEHLLRLHSYKGTRIVSPAAFLTFLRSEAG